MWHKNDIKNVMKTKVKANIFGKNDSNLNVYILKCASF